jgi:NAD(P)H-hydrate epimerase
LIDGLLGTGLKGEARGTVVDLIRAVNQSRVRTAAVDVPSGIGDAFRKGYPAVCADVTLTIGLPKLSLYLPAARAHCGEIHVVEGIFPRELLVSEAIKAELLRDEELGELLPKIPADTYKNARGHLAVFAGSEGTTGAAWLCAHAAARSRTGLVTVQMQQELYPACVPAYSSVMIRPWDADGKPSALSLDRFTGLLVGPGWGLGERREAWLETLLEAGLPGLLDADGITLLSRIIKRHRIELGGRWVLTPHPGEFARLIGEETATVLADPLPLLRRTSAALGATIVLKGHCTFVCAPDGRLWILDGMNPAMATGGSGDVLSGIIAGQLAGGVEAPAAARLGVLLHGMAGRLTFASKGYFTADELLPAIGRLTGG